MTFTDFKIIILSITSSSNFTIDNSGNTFTVHSSGVTAAEEVKRSAAEAEQKEKKVAKAAPKEKKSKTAKSPKTASHPTYFEMIKEALLALNERSGSSPYAIAKYMEEKHKSVLPANFRKILGLQLKNSAAKGKLTKIKASYKLSDAGKKEKSAAAKKPSSPSPVKKGARKAVAA